MATVEEIKQQDEKLNIFFHHVTAEQLYQLLTATGHNVGIWRNDFYGLKAYLITVLSQ